jgi:hypothetical protein
MQAEIWSVDASGSTTIDQDKTHFGMYMSPSSYPRQILSGRRSRNFSRWSFEVREAL